MSSRRSLSLILPLGLLLTGCAPSEPSAAPSSNEERPTRVAGAAEVARGEALTASPASSRLVAVAESSKRAGREHVAQPVLRQSRLEGATLAAEGEHFGHDGRSAVAAVQEASPTTAQRSRLAEGSAPNEAGLPLRVSTGGRTNTAAVAAAVAAVGAPAAAIAREQSPPLPLAVVAAAHAQSFTPEQMRALVQLGESFLTETSPTSPNAVTAVVASPDLTPAERWEISANASDERFKAMFGYQAFNSMQLQRAREAYAEAKAK
ncbi:MAG: hypothetical protein H2172_10470 [Opitutus sp.]|nr:hypothetical protein [Opitutus sp.]MCS6247778.1 hypothetical protein [Opitutus sp.]MCS6274350.1 hypothetical protein [Opitutus sp.]MCS6276775.1 hypothetical protein [Opitutus sp.]MCS6301576.1 hypothetical protein [Opitutus sp.]